jgi:hypothetical protein
LVGGVGGELIDFFKMAETSLCLSSLGNAAQFPLKIVAIANIALTIIA